jgi:endonuclease I
MNTKFVLLAQGLALLTGAVACDDATTVDKGALSPPTIADPSKADAVGDPVLDRGRLSFDEPVEGLYDHDGQNEGFVFTGEAGAVLTLDNTHKGTTRNLDTQLFLYGPADEAGFFGTEPIAADDDGGYGYHARIKAFTLPERGTYRVVMGTYMSIDRGRYRLLLSCLSERCVVPCDATCGHEDVCSGAVCDETDGCLSAPPPAACTEALPDVPGLWVSETEVLTDEGRGSDAFTVRLTGEPTEDVTVWVRPSDLNEAAVFPQKLWFCAGDRVAWRNGCRDALEGEASEAPHWQREVQVQVFGVNDDVQDDTAFTIDFRVISEDPAYAELAVPSLEGLNLEGGKVPDYRELSALRDDVLLGSLHAALQGHTAYGYNGQNSMRTIMFSAVDVVDGAVSSIYTTEQLNDARDSTRAYGMGFNVEHTWPQGQFDKLEPMKSDLHHTFPSDIESNSSRSSYDYGLNGAADGVSRLGPSALGSSLVYQPRAERRGDIARAHFYMAARYKFDDTIGLRFDDNHSVEDGCIADAEEAVLRAWHEADPVSAQERTRNHRVEAYQGNRNPFIDQPDLVGRIADF